MRYPQNLGFRNLPQVLIQPIKTMLCDLPAVGSVELSAAGPKGLPSILATIVKSDARFVSHIFR